MHISFIYLKAPICDIFFHVADGEVKPIHVSAGVEVRAKMQLVVSSRYSGGLREKNIREQ